MDAFLQEGKLEVKHTLKGYLLSDTICRHRGMSLLHILL